MADSILPQDHSTDNLKRDLGLSIDITDADYLRGLVDRMRNPFRVDQLPSDTQIERLDQIADSIKEVVRDIGVLRAALHLNEEVR